MQKFINLLKYERFQDEFIHNYIQYINENPNYYFYLRHCDKKLKSKLGCFSVEIYDVLDNDGLRRLIEAIHKLKKEDQYYEVDCNYKKRKSHKIRYIRPEEEHKISAMVAGIKFKNDKYIRDIDIRYTLLNNTEIVVRYKIGFKRIMYQLVEQHDFIYNNILRYCSGYYFHSYADRTFFDKAKMDDIVRLEDVLWGDVLQGVIYTLFYTKLGQYYKLPVVYNTAVKKYNFKVRKRLKTPFLTTVYENSDGQIMWLYSLNYDRKEIYYFSHGRTLKESSIYNLFMDYGMEFYFSLFDVIEEREIDRILGKYFDSSNYKRIGIREQKWLINKIRSIDDRKNIIFWTQNRKINSDIEHKWKCLRHGKYTEYKLVDFPQKCDQFKEKYERYLRYFSTVSGIHYNLIIYILTIVTLIISIISIIVSIVLQ